MIVILFTQEGIEVKSAEVPDVVAIAVANVSDAWDADCTNAVVAI
jgi:hypothetical protein